jgi:hypothetical protein
MSLKANLKPYMFALGLIFSLFFSNLCLAYPNLPAESFSSIRELNQYNAWPVTLHIPASYFSESDYGYQYGRLFGQVNIFDLQGNKLFMWAGYDKTYTTIVSQGYADFSGTIPKDNFISFEIPSGNYYISFWPSYWNEVNLLKEDTYAYIPFSIDLENNILSNTSLEPINGECGEAYGQVLTTIPPESSYACSTGTMINFNGGLNELGTGIKYFWECEGSNGGYSVACSSAETLDIINGTCGSANGQTISTAPYEYEKCSYGATNGSTLQTLNGWTWSCYGFNGGSTSYCSAIYQEAEEPPIIPDSSVIPTPTDCETYSGIDKVLCNFGNIIQGMFLPSSEKIIELQITMNEVGNVFPFNYLRAISSVFNNLNFSSGSLRMTMWGNTETLGEDFWEMEIFDNIKLGITILILLMFTFWAIGYIKHFFK